MNDMCIADTLRDISDESALNYSEKESLKLIAKQVEVQAERIKELEKIYLGQIRVVARSRLTYKERVERMAALAEQALKG